MYGILYKEHFVFCYYFKMINTFILEHLTYTKPYTHSHTQLLSHTHTHTHFTPEKILKIVGGCMVRQRGI